MRIIPLSRGFFTIIDDEDFERISQFKWSVSQNGRRNYLKYWYAHRKTWPEKKTVFMHRFILNASPDLQVDHMNRNTLDNRKCNLRVCKRDGNMQNRQGNSNHTSRFKGVSFENYTKKWKSQIHLRGKHISLGRYISEEGAAKAYDVAARKYFGTFAYTNF